MTDFIAFALAALIGISLGLIGGGGSILTVPVLVYVSGINPVLSTAYSLFIVGFTSLVGGIDNYRKGLVSFKTALVFALPSLIAVYLTRLFLIPIIPEELFSVAGFAVTKQLALMLLFAVLMIGASFSMIRSKNEMECEANQKQEFNFPLIFIEGTVVGVLTGMVGAGGGFLIIPALVLLSKLPIKLAIGTSLLIIAAKSLLGFVGDLQAGQQIDWSYLLLFTLFSTLGIFAGGYLSKFISGSKLKTGFGWFVLVMGFYILVKELWR